MPSKETKTLESNQYQGSDEVHFIIYTNIECSLEKIDGCKFNPENSSAIQVSKHIPSVFPISTISSFGRVENKHVVYGDKYFMKKFCESWREHTMKVISFKKKKNKSLTKE